MAPKGRSKKGLKGNQLPAKPVALEGEVLPPDAEPTESESTPVDVDDDEVSVEDLPVEVTAAEEPVLTTKELTRFDPLTSYLQEVSRHPPLSREEEHEVALRYLKDKDREAAYKLVVSNLWLVVKIAREYERAARNLLDLVQEGNIGLIEAVKNFDPYRGVRFPSYAVWWVKAYIIRYIIANWRMVKIGTTQAQRKLFFNLKKERDKLERQGFLPAPKLLAQRLNVKEGEIIEMEQRLGNSEVSVDAPLQDDSDSTLLSVIPSENLSAEEALSRKQTQALVLNSLDEFATELNEKERMIFRERMLGEEKATLQEISEKLSISRERVRQIENRLRDRLKIFLAAKLGNEAGDLGEIE